MQDEFIRELAEFLAGPNQAGMSIRLQANPNDELAGVWFRLRTKTPLHGYPDVDEAVDVLTKFLGAT